MDYKGQQVKMRPEELEALASSFGLTPAHIKTVTEVETSGRAFNSVGWPDFLFEPHKFYQNVPKDKLAEAIKKGLAYPKWKGPGSYPKTLQLRINQFLEAAKLDETAAIKSASWGLGQIMGSECVEAGYKSPQDMLQAFMDSEAAQIKGMLTLIKHRGLDQDLLNFPDMAACNHFALRYNGAGYKKNNYHVKLHDTYIRLAGKQEVHGSVDTPDDGVVRFGDRGPAVEAIQRALKEGGGYSLQVDGIFGPGTRTAILAWKANEGMDTSSADMSPADMEMLKQISPKPVALERATATVEDLKPKSTIIQQTSLGKKILGWLGIGTGSIGLLGTGQDSGTSVLDKAQDVADKATQVKGIAGTFSELVGGTGLIGLLQVVYAWRFPILIVGVVVGFFIFDKVQKKRLEMHQKAEIG